MQSWWGPLEDSTTPPQVFYSLDLGSCIRLEFGCDMMTELVQKRVSFLFFLNPTLLDLQPASAVSKVYRFGQFVWTAPP